MRNPIKLALVTALLGATFVASSQPGGGGGAICYENCTTPNMCTTNWLGEKSRTFCKSMDWVVYCQEWDMVERWCSSGGPGDPLVGRRLELRVQLPGYSCDGSNIECY